MYSGDVLAVLLGGQWSVVSADDFKYLGRRARYIHFSLLREQRVLYADDSASVHVLRRLEGDGARASEASGVAGLARGVRAELGCEHMRLDETLLRGQQQNSHGAGHDLFPALRPQDGSDHHLSEYFFFFEEGRGGLVVVVIFSFNERRLCLGGVRCDAGACIYHRGLGHGGPGVDQRELRHGVDGESRRRVLPGPRLELREKGRLPLVHDGGNGHKEDRPVLRGHAPHDLYHRASARASPARDRDPMDDLGHVDLGAEQLDFTLERRARCALRLPHGLRHLRRHGLEDATKSPPRRRPRPLRPRRRRLLRESENIHLHIFGSSLFFACMDLFILGTILTTDSSNFSKQAAAYTALAAYVLRIGTVKGDSLGALLEWTNAIAVIIFILLDVDHTPAHCSDVCLSIALLTQEKCDNNLLLHDHHADLKSALLSA